MSVVFLGTSDFAAAILERLAAHPEHRPALVVTRPDRRRGRGMRLSPPAVARTARALGLTLAQPESVNDAQARELIAAARAGGTSPCQAAGADERRHTVVVCAFGALIKEPLLSEHELLNVHPSLLPRWRGAAPIERAIMAGDAATGVSIMRLTAGLDSGPVCLAGSEAISPTDTYGTLAARLQELGAGLLLQALDRKAAGAPPIFVEQDEAGVTYADKIEAGDRLLDPARPAQEAERRVRALDPHIGARVRLRDGSLLRVHRARVATAGARDGGPALQGEEPAPDAAGILVADGRLLLRCAEGELELQVVQPPGGRPMEASAFLRGHGPALGA